MCKDFHCTPLTDENGYPIPKPDPACYGTPKCRCHTNNYIDYEYDSKDDLCDKYSIQDYAHCVCAEDPNAGTCGGYASPK